MYGGVCSVEVLIVRGPWTTCQGPEQDVLMSPLTCVRRLCFMPAASPWEGPGNSCVLPGQVLLVFLSDIAVMFPQNNPWVLVAFHLP